MLEKNIRRYKLIDEHRRLVREGKLIQANIVLHLLRKGKVALGLDDESYAVESLCEDIGCRISYSRNFNVSEVRI